MIIRDAVDDDWPQLYSIITTTAQDGRTFAYPENLTSDQAHRLWMLDPPGRTVVAVDGDGLILGTATMNQNRSGRGSHIATASFMIAAAARGQGAGRSLGEHVLQWAHEQGYRAMQFNAVVETNHHAVHLWKSLGFEIIGTVPAAFYHADDGYVGLHIMHRSLV